MNQRISSSVAAIMAIIGLVLPLSLYRVHMLVSLYQRELKVPRRGESARRDRKNVPDPFIAAAPLPSPLRITLTESSMVSINNGFIAVTLVRRP